MRLRWASLFVAFCVLTSATMAYAECAWVAWLTAVHETGFRDITPIGSSHSKAECEQRVAGIQSSLEEMMHARKMIVSAMICLPDTVDPRGPKGK